MTDKEESYSLTDADTETDAIRADLDTGKIDIPEANLRQGVVAEKVRSLMNPAFAEEARILELDGATHVPITTSEDPAIDIPVRIAHE